jgi:hypothetical protein
VTEPAPEAAKCPSGGATNITNTKPWQAAVQCALPVPRAQEESIA